MKIADMKTRLEELDDLLAENMHALQSAAINGNLPRVEWLTAYRCDWIAERERLWSV